MAGLAAALAAGGCEVVYVAERPMSKARALQGWTPPSLGDARLVLAPTRAAVRNIVDTASLSAIHICQGIRDNGLIGLAQRALAKRHLRQWVIMETVDDSGLRGVLKRLEYRRLFRAWYPVLEGVLATGWQTQNWVAARGMPSDQVFPFAYFLPEPAEVSSDRLKDGKRFRFLFVGQLIERKRVDLLIKSLALMKHDHFELVVVGDGPEASSLKTIAEEMLPGHSYLLGWVPMDQVRQLMSEADCLVLPSRHDGWGAVVSEALMVGTPVVCSDACGSAGIVVASGMGAVFPRKDPDALQRVLRSALDRGHSNTQSRRELAHWATSLGTGAGAKYLLKILNYAKYGGVRPLPPWQDNT